MIKSNAAYSGSALNIVKKKKMPISMALGTNGCREPADSTRGAAFTGNLTET